MTRTVQTGEYVQYLRAEWDLFERNPSRGQTPLAAVSDLKVARVLDVGCGAAQELLPFVSERHAFGVGIDEAVDAAKVALELFADRTLRGRVAFVRARAEQLPCHSNSFDVVVCRLALPYTANRRALSEMARVLRTGGVILLQFHHALFYVKSLGRAVMTFRLKSALHNLFVLAAGTFYFITGTQPRARLIAGEVFQTRWMLRRELAPLGLEIRAPFPESRSDTPSLVLVKKISG